MGIGHPASPSPLTQEAQGQTDFEPGPVNNEGALGLLQEWLADETGYDQNVWAHLREVIEEHRLSARNRFRD